MCLKHPTLSENVQIVFLEILKQNSILYQNMVCLLKHKKSDGRLDTHFVFAENFIRQASSQHKIFRRPPFFCHTLSSEKGIEHS